MQWLTAILAFVTTMLIFSIIVSTLVETIHRFLGSRPFGLIKMLERMYDDVILPQLTRGAEEIKRSQFVDDMIWIRPSNGAASSQSGTAVDTNDASSTPSTMLFKSWKMLPRLQVESFMERLGASKFSTMLDNKFGEGSEEREQVLKDIAQKYELYGQEAGIYFGRKARSWSVAVSMLVAWIFYVHPHELIHTYLQQPEVAAAVADLHDDALRQFEEIEDGLKAAASAEVPADDDLLTGIQKKLDEARQDLKPLEATGAPIGWSEDKGICFPEFLDKLTGKVAEDVPQQGAADAGNNQTDKDCWVYLPRKNSDYVWLLLGGLLVGLGAPFWARAVRQVAEVRNISENITQILKPELQSPSVLTRQVAATGAELPTTTRAFNASAAGQRLGQQPGQQDNP